MSFRNVLNTILDGEFFDPLLQVFQEDLGEVGHSFPGTVLFLSKALAQCGQSEEPTVLCFDQPDFIKNLSFLMKDANVAQIKNAFFFALQRSTAFAPQKAGQPVPVLPYWLKELFGDWENKQPPGKRIPEVRFSKRKLTDDGVEEKKGAKKAKLTPPLSVLQVLQQVLNVRVGVVSGTDVIDEQFRFFKFWRQGCKRFLKNLEVLYCGKNSGEKARFDGPAKFHKLNGDKCLELSVPVPHDIHSHQKVTVLTILFKILSLLNKMDLVLTLRGPVQASRLNEVPLSERRIDEDTTDVDYALCIQCVYDLLAGVFDSEEVQHLFTEVDSGKKPTLVVVPAEQQRNEDVCPNCGNEQQYHGRIEGNVVFHLCYICEYESPREEVQLPEEWRSTSPQ